MHERMVEWTIESSKPYADPFNDVEVDVVFSKDGQSWRVPTFWRGNRQWTVRFASPSPGEYSYRLQCTDPSNPDLNGCEGTVQIGAYRGSNDLLRHGMLRVSRNRRHFEHIDGTPFYWLGDTWWTCLSDRLSWADFQTLCADRKSKGYTVVQTVAGFPPEEEVPALDQGFQNEGGPVWEPDLRRINPRYFDYMDRRILHLIDSGIIPAIVGAWTTHVEEKNPAKLSFAKLKQHWRNLVARYGAYPVFWIVGGEVLDPPDDGSHCCPKPPDLGAWTDVTRYVRAIDPYHHPLTVHERPLPLDRPVQDESLTDFDLFQSSHFGWSSAALGVTQITAHYSRTFVTKPVVQGEIGNEQLFSTHFEDFQRYAFWTTMLNGAAGHTYGADGVMEAYTADKPLHPMRWSFLSWEEGMKLPGSYQVALGAKLMRRFRWWHFEPHPEWVTPRGRTSFDPHRDPNSFDLGFCEIYQRKQRAGDNRDFADFYGDGLAHEWCEEQGGFDDFRAPYAAGIPGEVRIIYVPYPSVGFNLRRTSPTVLGLEQGIRYNAYLWEPSLGVRVDLGVVERALPGPILFNAALSRDIAVTSTRKPDKSPLRGEAITVLKEVSEKNATARITARAGTYVAIVLRYRDPDNYVAAVYSPEDNSLCLVDRRQGTDSRVLGQTPVPALAADMTLSVEMRGPIGAASISDGEHTYTTPIVDLCNTAAGSAGLMLRDHGDVQSFGAFELRRSSDLIRDERLDRKLYDARGTLRGDMTGSSTTLVVGSLTMPSWDDFGRYKHIVLDAYRPEALPTSGDWVIVLENDAAVSS